MLLEVEVDGTPAHYYARSPHVTWTSEWCVFFLLRCVVSSGPDVFCVARIFPSTRCLYSALFTRSMPRYHGHQYSSSRARRRCIINLRLVEKPSFLGIGSGPSIRVSIPTGGESICNQRPPSIHTSSLTIPLISPKAGTRLKSACAPLAS